MTGFRDAAAEDMTGPFAIVRDFERPDPALLDALKEAGAYYPVAFAGPLGLGPEIMLDPAIRPLRPFSRLWGPAFTVKAHDNLMAMYAIKLARPGDVIVVEAGGWSTVSVWGGSMTRSATIRGLGGVLVDGMVCDAQLLAQPDVDPRYAVPLFCRGVTGAYSTWEKPGSINVPVTVGGVRIAPGDLVVGSHDGVAVVPRARLGEALAKAKVFLAEMARLQRPMNEEGLTFFDALGLQPVIDALAIPERER